MPDHRGTRPIRRHELASQSASSEPDLPGNALENRYHENLEQRYGQETTAHNAIGGIRLNHNDLAPPSLDLIETQGAYDFPLFARRAVSTPTKSSKIGSQGLQRVLLRSPTPASSEPGFLNLNRPEKYYFTGYLSPRQTEDFRQSSVTGEYIMKESRTKWPGSDLPWRVITLKVNTENRKSSAGFVEQVPSGKRKRSGKKRRISIRAKIKAESAKKLADQQNIIQKEAAEREKRTRKNREKKVKRREKGRIKKVQEAKDGG